MLWSWQPQELIAASIGLVAGNQQTCNTPAASPVAAAAYNSSGAMLCWQQEPQQAVWHLVLAKVGLHAV